MDDLVELTPEEQRRRKRRSLAVGLALAALVVLFYIVTVVKFFPDSVSS